MIIEYGTDGFKNEWLKYLDEDPVHNSIEITVKLYGSRTVLAYVEADIPQAIICVKFGNKLPQNMQYILSNEITINNENQFQYVIFYSIFRLKHATVKGAGAIAIKKAKAYFKEKQIKKFYTLSPIPELTKNFKHIPTESEIIQYLQSGLGAVAKFHIGNGGAIHAVNFNADMTPQRIYESWGIMVNYDYSDYA